MNLTTELRRLTRGNTRTRGIFDRHHRGGTRPAAPRLSAFRRSRPATGPLARLKGLAGRVRRTLR
ncbi:hypothetical protein [Actinocorallia populi]|uniref:hypothetical protein n=1 Tax=Actinocorallia populi TaxID=2079200 RepID=UPI000D093F96|nr:hypothetical protein [Actinocorallia populi]